MSLEHGGDIPGGPIFGGLSVNADIIFNSSGEVAGYGFIMRGSLIAAYLARGQESDLATTCEVAFKDPTEDILSKLNEIVFRIALTGPSSTPVTEFIAQQHTAVVYESRYDYLWGALAIAASAAAFVAWTAAGFQALGRPVSLSPVEIATAFDSPLLQKPGTSNITVAELLTAYKGTRIQYLSTDGSGAEGMTGDSKKRLQLTDPGQGTKPRAQETFTG